jgi:16S rRNA (cytosine1402-N4)-methyltransferase
MNYLDTETVMVEEKAEHIPVMLNEVIQFLNLKPGDVVVDATIGLGGHGERILEEILPGGKLVGIDRDSDSLALTEKRLSRFKGHFYLFHENFINLDKVLDSLNIKKVDAILFDLGISSYQLDSKRGFSFKEDAFLDMRMDRDETLTAYDIVNYYSLEDLSSIIKNYGEERYHRRIAEEIVKARKLQSIETTRELKEIVLKAVPYAYLKQRIHPATRTFQALRIAVNKELENLEKALDKAVELLLPGGRVVVVSFHSLEDRIVKRKFKHFKKENRVEIITPKPVRPTDFEIQINPRARSAKLRCIQKRNNHKNNVLLKIFLL